MRRRAIACAALTAIAVACSGSNYDPYAVYLKNKPADAPTLSREDAQGRAVLGCLMSTSVKFDPKTVDGVLQAAYGCHRR